MSDDMMQKLGNIEGLLVGITKAQDKQSEQLDGIDGRLRKVENTSAITGAITGGVVAVAVGLIKGALGKGGA